MGGRRRLAGVLPHLARAAGRSQQQIPSRIQTLGEALRQLSPLYGSRATSAHPALVPQAPLFTSRILPIDTCPDEAVRLSRNSLQLRDLCRSFLSSSCSQISENKDVGERKAVKECHHGLSKAATSWGRGRGREGCSGFLISQFPNRHIVHFSSSTGGSSSGREKGQTPRVIPAGGFLSLNSLSDNKGAVKKGKRLGRGIGSGKGKTAGRGHKGQKSRSGRKPRVGFEGGQTPLRLRLPKRGFHNPFSLSFQEVNIGDIVKKVQEGAIDPTKLVTMKTLKEAKLGGKATRDGIKLLARGAHLITFPLDIEVSRVSEAAKTAIEGAGGSVTRVHYNKLGLRALLDPGWFAKKGRLLPRAARPPPKILPAIDAVGRLPAPIFPLHREGSREA